MSQAERARLRERVEALTDSQREWLAARLTDKQQGELVAWIVVDGPPPPRRALVDHLGQRLPRVMIPAHFLTVEALPRTAAGKLDREALTGLAGNRLPDRLEAADTTSTPSDEATPRPPAKEGDTGPGHTAAGTQGPASPDFADPVVAGLLAIWRDVLGTDDVRLDDDFFEIGGDSLLSIRVIAKAGKAGIQITPDAFFENPTVAHLAEAAREERTREREEGSLVSLQTAGDGPPLIAVPGVGGEVTSLVRLARTLGDRRFYGLQSRGLAGEAPPRTTIEEIAADFVDQISELTEEPYDLLGICWGASVAFEMARILGQRGRPPRWVALMNPAVLLRRPDAARESAGMQFLKNRLDLYWDEFREKDWRSRGRMILDKARRASNVARRPSEARAAGEEIHRMRVQEANRVAVVRYLPEPAPMRARIFMTPAGDLGGRPDPRLEWLDLIRPGPSITPIEGSNSGDALGQANVEVFAAALSELLGHDPPPTDRESGP